MSWMKSFYLWLLLVSVFNRRRNPARFNQIVSSLSSTQVRHIRKIGYHATKIIDKVIVWTKPKASASTDTFSGSDSDNSPSQE